MRKYKILTSITDMGVYVLKLILRMPCRVTAGEVGLNPRIPYGSNKTCNLSSRQMQGYFGGKAWVLVPQCPTVWMDDGVEQLGKSNQSIYVRPVKDCIDHFVKERKEQVDTERIYIGGLSNGGFMTMRMLFDYPDFFAGAIPACQAFYSENATREMLDTICHMPIWFAHCKTDELVPPLETALPIYHRLKAAGAKNIHFTYYPYMCDLTGRYGTGTNMDSLYVSLTMLYGCMCLTTSAIRNWMEPTYLITVSRLPCGSGWADREKIV